MPIYPIVYIMTSESALDYLYGKRGVSPKHTPLYNVGTKKTEQIHKTPLKTSEERRNYGSI